MRACLRARSDDLGGRVARGAAWMTMLIVVRTAATIGSTAILARLLQPTDYGYVAMATVVMELVAMCCVFGLPAIIVQSPRLRRVDLDTGFWFSAGLGTAAVAATIAGAGLFARAFRAPDLVPILWAMSALVALDEFSAVHQSIAYRLLLVRQEVFSQLTNLFVRIAVSVGLALADFGVWSLVWGSIVGRAAQAFLICYLIPYVPRFRFDPDFLIRNAKAGVSYFGSAVLMFVSSSVDTTVVGRVFGPRDLGYYQTAFALPEELRTRLSVALQRVLFPAYALVQFENSAFRSSVLRSLRLFAALAMPMGIGMAVLARPIVRTLYGEHWLPVVPLLRIVAIAGILRALHALLVNIYRAKGRPDLDFKLGLALTPLLLVCVLVGSRYDTIGVAVGVLLFSLAVLASASRALELIELDPWTTLAALLPATIAAAVMGGGLLALDALHAIPGSTPIVELAAGIAIGVVLFVASLFVISRGTVAEIWAMRQFLRVSR